MSLRLFAIAPLGLSDLLAEELGALGGRGTRAGPGGVSFTGTLEVAYRACLWSRVASRVRLELARFPVSTTEALYEGVRTILWREHLAVTDTLRVDFNGKRSCITHSAYGARLVKDAVVDQFRDAIGRRPDVDRESPDVRIYAHLDRGQASIGIDLGGSSLHRRGYRDAGLAAPLKENLAAAILLRGGWPAIAAAGGPMADPMCGSGTLPIEAALIARDIAPGLSRAHFGFERWQGHDSRTWLALREEAEDRARRGRTHPVSIIGFDASARAVGVAAANAASAGAGEGVRFERATVAALEPAVLGTNRPGLVAVNPPYGERLGERGSLAPVYEALGDALRRQFAGWQAVILTADDALGERLRLPGGRSQRLFNGPIECRLRRVEIPAAPVRPRAAHASPALSNRLRKNYRSLAKWIRRDDITCYRLYDADMPEYAVAVDVYEADDRWAHVQEYAAPASVNPRAAARRLEEALASVAEVLEIPVDRIRLKQRSRQRGAAQYSRTGTETRPIEVREGRCRLLVNLDDYLDTGLFLDHRALRHRIGEESDRLRFLNLFAYTGAATVHAACGGAVETLSIDRSRTYCEWGERNLAVNRLDRHRHRYQRADCLDWVEREAASPRSRRFNLILLNPPTFSNSKSSPDVLDVQRDHPRLIAGAARLLTDGGVLYFSTNYRRFRLDTATLPELSIENISAATVPRDFARSPRIHQCWRITRTAQ